MNRGVFFTVIAANGDLPYFEIIVFSKDNDFKRERATLSYGVVGVKVWIYRGKIFAEKKNARPASEKADLKND
jgi:hypothetical protein